MTLQWNVYCFIVIRTSINHCDNFRGYQKFPITFASSAFVYTKAPNSGSRRCREPLFLLVGKHPKPFEQTTALVWLRGFAALGHVPKG